VAQEPELPEGRFKEVTPLAKVGFVHVEDDMNMVANGDALDLGRGGVDRSFILDGGLRGRGVMGRRSHGQRKKESG
jgi:hypothetical protein